MGKKGKRGESTNPKHKYHQRTKNRGGEGGSIVEQHHKQEPPKFLPASRAVEDMKKEDEDRIGNNEVPEQLTEEQPDLEEMVEELEGSEEAVTELNVVPGEDQGATGGSPGQGIQTSAVPSVNEATDLSATTDTPESVEKVSVCTLVIAYCEQLSL